MKFLGLSFRRTEITGNNIDESISGLQIKKERKILVEVSKLGEGRSARFNVCV